MSSSLTSPNPFTTTRSPFFSTSHSLPKTNHRFRVSCNLVSDDHINDQQLIIPENKKVILPPPPTHNVDRRGLLLGLGGLYSTVNFTSLPTAFAAPITAPDISTCVAANEGFQDANNTVRGKACCPPTLSKTVKEFVLPKDKVTRIRPAAHRASAEYVAKYKQALQAMRALPDDHPHSFVQQAKIHCAYCNGGYSQVASGYPEKELQIHNSWLFFPFHRWYLYFYERILGKLINDPTFALPYWNWDNPSGMNMPAFFEEDGKTNPAFDAFRDASHIPPAVLEIDYNGKDSGTPCIQLINSNLTSMYKQMISNAPDALSFFGGEFRAGDDAIQIGNPSIGSIEAGVHTAVHRWVGNPRQPNNEDMGNFYSAGYDPAFYVHHANVDRMWKIWKDLGIKGHSEPTDPDWQNASYVFYDENENLVRVYNKDCVKLENLKYDYEPSPLVWLKSRPVARNKKSNIAKKSVGNIKKAEDVKFPLKVDKIVKVLVSRPAKGRNKADKENANEILLINGIKFDGGKFVKFDVFVNDQDDVTASSAAESEFAGSFAQLPHNHKDTMLMSSAARFGLTELLEDIGAEDDDFVLVTLVPKVGCEEVSVGEIKIVLVPIV